MKETKNTSAVAGAVSMLRPSVELMRYFVVIGIFSAFMFIFSLIMVGIVRSRDVVDQIRRAEARNVYGGELKQSAPTLNQLTADSAVAQEFKYNPVQLAEFAQNANIVSTKEKIQLDADFVKKGLQYEPTFHTSFEATYVLKNNLTKESAVSFEFPFPFQIANSEISNVKLIVDGEEIEKAKGKVMVSGQRMDGLKWEGKLPAEGEATIQVSYDTVGISGLNYEGFENKVGAQDFYMEMTIAGTRDYNIAGGLSADTRTFGDNQVTLVWDKKNLFSTPNIHVNVGKKLAPSIQVSKVYATMAPLYALFAGILVWLGYKNRKRLLVRDLVFTTVIFALYFPLWHYLTSFTIDPTMEFFSSWKQVPNFSMSLYGGFAIAFVIVGALLSWLYSAAYGVKHTVSALFPAVVICLGFFPLAMTVPDYSILLCILGLIVLASVWVRFRLQEDAR